MKVVRKIGLLSLLLVATVLVSNASAAIMPISSYATAVGNWQGSSYYDYGTLTNGGYLSGRVDYAVYDTTNVFGAEATFVTDFGDTDKFLYVYQIFNDDEALNNVAVNYFAVFNLDETTLGLDEGKITSVDDADSGIEPTGDGYLGNETGGEVDSRVIWSFSGGQIYKGEHSWYLAFSTNSAPVVGDYEIKASDIPVPEPGMITLFSVGAAMVLGKRKKSTS